MWNKTNHLDKAVNLIEEINLQNNFFQKEKESVKRIIAELAMDCIEGSEVEKECSEYLNNE